MWSPGGQQQQQHLSTCWNAGFGPHPRTNEIRNSGWKPSAAGFEQAPCLILMHIKCENHSRSIRISFFSPLSVLPQNMVPRKCRCRCTVVKEGCLQSGLPGLRCTKMTFFEAVKKWKWSGFVFSEKENTLCKCSFRWNTEFVSGVSSPQCSSALCNDGACPPFKVNSLERSVLHKHLQTAQKRM